MKATTESAFLKFMAKVSKAIDSEGETTPEDITPEMLDDNNFRQRIKLYGHSVEEVEQLIAEGKCIWAVRIDDFAAEIYEDIKYSFDTYFIDKNNNKITKEALNTAEYILYSVTDISSGILLHKSNNEFVDALSTFNVLFNDGDSYCILVGVDTA